ncbi:MAG: hypothetical protein JWM43_2240 [Acidobacteriaceae bacterium]|nr:hypothetical protein [Acidobacteriaceae bacterium]
MRITYRLASTAVASLLLVSPLLAGCNRNPNVEIVGSYFPGWMISLVVAVALSFFVHALLRRRGMEGTLGHPVVIYPGIVLLLTCLLWLCFFA